MKICILRSVFHDEITKNLQKGAEKLIDSIPEKKRPKLYYRQAAGAFELPLLCKLELLTKKCHAVMALGCLIKGKTPHFQFISEACANGLMQVSLELAKPIGFGVITALNSDQARKRSSLTAASLQSNKGYEAALAVLTSLKKQ